MKVKMDRNYRKYYTLEQVDQAKAVIAWEKEDEETAAGWARYAVNEALKGTGVSAADWMDGWILKADATTARNGRAWNQYGEGTGDMDIWIDAVVRTGEGFLEVGAYLSDIWLTGATDYRQHMYIKRYATVEA